MIAKSHRWHKTAMAAAAIALLGLSGNGALALSLGRLTVQSALGEPLRAEIDVPDINAEEAASLRTNVAPPDAFVAAGLEYNPAMSGLQASLQRRADGRAFIRLSSDRPINDPFIDLILETNWSSGRIVRDYTMLFDPPVLRNAAQTAPTLAQTNAPAGQTAPGKSSTSATLNTIGASEPARSPAQAARPANSAPAAPAPAPAIAKPAPKPVSEDSKRVVVKTGDTATKIAANTKPAGVSLDQMLVALLRRNPDAFVNDNINRVKSGAVMNVPTAEQALAVPVAEASQIVVAQSKDFNDFRRNLASNAPTAAVGTADRKASGSIEAKVEDKKPAASTPDKLTLSKGSVQSKADDAKLLKEQSEKDAKLRAAEIAKNISDLKKIGAASTPAAPTPAASAPAPKAPAVPVTAPTAAVAASAPAPVASAPAVTAPVPQPAASAAAATPTVPNVEPVEEPGLLDELLDNPLVPLAAGGFIALLGGFAFYRRRQAKKNTAQVDSSFLESRLQPDSFFGASGGQRVDTSSEGAVSGSSMVYSASQLDAADDVDPVAEADVYLAYGRDLQAEEILKEAAKTNPGRLAIHTKLLEIFAKRRDVRSFEASATQAYKLTGGNGPDWNRVCELGLSIDPNNALYQPGGAPSNTSPQGAQGTTPSTFGSTVPQSAHAELPAASGSVDLDLDLDLDFSLDDEPASAISDVTGGTVSQVTHDQTIKMEAADADNALEMDFDLSDPAPLSAVAEEKPTALPELPVAMDGLSLDDDNDHGLNFDATGPMPVATPAPAPVADTSGMLEFDLGSLSLDLDPPTPAPGPTQAPSIENEDPLETKLALAEEFVSIGDEDGARALIEEVIAEATGDMRAKAQRALAQLS